MAGIVLNGAATIGPGPYLPSSVVASNNTTVFSGGKPVVVSGDQVVTHIKPGNDPAPIAGKVIATSSTVFIGGKPVARIGDTCDKGETLVESATNVFAG